MKCDTCMHEIICMNRSNMKKFEGEIREKEKLLENQTFHADIRCDNFSRKNTVNIR